jgi:hypothetical protein
MRDGMLAHDIVAMYETTGQGKEKTNYVWWG